MANLAFHPQCICCWARMEEVRYLGLPLQTGLANCPSCKEQHKYVISERVMNLSRISIPAGYNGTIERKFYVESEEQKTRGSSDGKLPISTSGVKCSLCGKAGPQDKMKYTSKGPSGPEQYEMVWFCEDNCWSKRGKIVGSRVGMGCPYWKEGSCKCSNPPYPCSLEKGDYRTSCYVYRDAPKKSILSRILGR
jgi:hypothetical protein